MGTCQCENWTLKDLAEALNSGTVQNKKIVVPTFQRGKRWKQNQKQCLIDSLINGFPVGTMLFYRSVKGTQEIYTLVDGLQRSSTVKEYINNPVAFFKDDDITGICVSSICNSVGADFDTSKDLIINSIRAGIVNATNKTIDDINWMNIALDIVNKFSITEGTKIVQAMAGISDALDPLNKTLKQKFNEISQMVIPVIVYTGDEDTLAVIFERINSQGTPLSPYDIYAASWPADKRYHIDNAEVVTKIMNKYDAMVQDGYTISNYDHNVMWNSRELTPYEYLFGLSRYINDNYPAFKFESGEDADIIINTGFELVNACLCDTKYALKDLHKELQIININEFENALREAINFVCNTISTVTKFKGNSRSGNDKEKLFHAKYQIISLTSYVFRKMYDRKKGFLNKRTNWNSIKDSLSTRLIQHYVFDIIAKNWNEGGHVQVHTRNNNDYYSQEITKEAWDAQLKSYLAATMTRKEVRKIANCSNEDIVFLNCVYLNQFTAFDQLGGAKFDVEHIATKNLMKKLVEQTDSDGISISSIANICYLPEDTNRSKKDKTIYQYDDLVNNPAKLKEYEDKYTFTQRADLDWVDIPYGNMDAQLLKDKYETYLKARFMKMQEAFYKSMGI